MSVASVVKSIKERQAHSTTFTSVHTMPALEAKFGDWPIGLDPRLRRSLDKSGKQRPYSHQAQCFDYLAQGHNVVVVTPTASGKTLCYNVPVLQAIVEDPEVTAIYLFPTKALAQDQLVELQALVGELEMGIGVSTYDGDTLKDTRKAVRARASVIITNPDMLHQGILPHHVRWSQLLSKVRFVVIDELHTYRGVFGSHLANLLRRLKRVCAFYGSKPQFVMCSATIANPGELAERLTGEPVKVVDQNGAPVGAKTIAFYNPPMLNPELGVRRSCIKSTLWFANQLLKSQVQTLVFATSRQNVEVMTRILKKRFEKEPSKAGMICGYRGGYLPNDRRQIERGIREGAIRGVISTNALELGIDIGALQAVVLAGYPGSVASTWQQIGRAGRRQEESLAVLVAKSAPLDQFIIEHPEYFRESSPERALINPDNLAILVAHIKCAAFELPFTEGELFGAKPIDEILDYLVSCKILFKSANEYHWTQDVYPANEISLRSASPHNFTVHNGVNNDRIIAEVDWNAVPTTLYEGAIFMVQASTYYVKTLDYDKQRATVEPVDSDYYTEAISSDSVRIIDLFEDEVFQSGLLRAHGEVHAATKVAGFKKIKFDTRENVGYGDVHLPLQEMHTAAFWLTLQEAFVTKLPLTRTQVIAGTVGLSYLLHNLAPFFLMCDVRDLRHCVGDRGGSWSVRPSNTGEGRLSLCVQPDLASNAASTICLGNAQGTEITAESVEVFEPTIFLYESLACGVGFAAEVYDLFPKLVEVAKQRIKTCSCESGCPSCVGPPNEVGSGVKQIALTLLEASGV